jgi:hypothetical protein
VAVPTTIPVTVPITVLSSEEVPTTELSYVEVPTTIVDVETNFETIEVPTTIEDVETSFETLYVTETDYITSLTTQPAATVFITSTLVETNTYTLPAETVTSQYISKHSILALIDSPQLPQSPQLQSASFARSISTQQHCASQHLILTQLSIKQHMRFSRLFMMR